MSGDKMGNYKITSAIIAFGIICAMPANSNAASCGVIGQDAVEGTLHVLDINGQYRSLGTSGSSITFIKSDTSSFAFVIDDESRRDDEDNLGGVLVLKTAKKGRESDRTVELRRLSGHSKKSVVSKCKKVYKDERIRQKIRSSSYERYHEDIVDPDAKDENKSLDRFHFSYRSKKNDVKCENGTNDLGYKFWSLNQRRKTKNNSRQFSFLPQLTIQKLFDEETAKQVVANRKSIGFAGAIAKLRNNGKVNLQSLYANSKVVRSIPYVLNSSLNNHNNKTCVKFTLKNRNELAFIRLNDLEHVHEAGILKGRHYGDHYWLLK